MTYLKIFLLKLLEQKAMLKSKLHNMERVQKRKGVDMTCLKNVILKLLETESVVVFIIMIFATTSEVEALLPMIGMLFQFSPEEIHKCQQVWIHICWSPKECGAIWSHQSL